MSLKIIAILKFQLKWYPYYEIFRFYSIAILSQSRNNFNNLIHILYLFYSTYILPKLQTKYSGVEYYTGYKINI